jgi:gamma-glutamyltranspeptidase/glutathione hydrolase
MCGGMVSDRPTLFRFGGGPHQQAARGLSAEPLTRRASRPLRGNNVAALDPAIYPGANSVLRRWAAEPTGFVGARSKVMTSPSRASPFRHQVNATMDFHTAGHRRGIVAAPHHAAAEAGRAILAEGGNALEAMVTMAATIAAVYPHMTHVGGDGFWLVRLPNGQIRALMGAGRAGAEARIERYREHGHDEIPPRGPLAALTAPCAVAGWMLALEAAKAHGARLPLRTLLDAAIRHAREGYVVSRSQAQLAEAHFGALKDVPGFAATFLPDGKPPAAGAICGQPALAATLDHLASAGLEDFYRGDIGREIAADLARIGSPVTRADLEHTRAILVEPLSVAIEAGAISGTLYNAPPPTQGLASLIILALFDRLRVTEPEGFDHIHGLIEATKRAFRVRDRFITDPDRLPAPPQQFLDAKFLDAEIMTIDRRKAARWPPSGNAGDTVWMGAADAGGLAVSYIQSLYWEFGSGCVLPTTGVLMQNRGASFSLDRRGLNALEPGRQPFHTLNPALAVLRDGRIMAYGTMGGDGQPQTQAAVFTRHVLYRVPLADAIDRPRWVLGRTWGKAVANLRFEDGFDGNVLDRLLGAGHDIDVLPERHSDTMGHPGG